LKQKVYSQTYLTLSNVLSFIIFPYYTFFNLFRKKYSLKKIKVKTILILEYHRIGDVLIILPVIKSIRRQYPRSKIVLVCCNDSYDLINHFNIVDKIIPVKMPWTNWDFSLKECFKVFQLIKKIRLEKTDLAFDFKGDLRNNWFLWNLKAKVSMGFSPTGGSYFLTNSFKFNHALHQRQRAQFIALKAGCDVLEKIKKNKININGRIALHLGSSDLRRSWTEKKWIKLARLLSKNFKITIIKIPESHHLINQIKKNKDKIDIFSGDLIEFKTWLKDQILLIGVDSMAGHLAAELGVPNISIFGSQNPDLTRPLGEFSEIIQPEKECHHKKKHWRLCAYCMDEIDETSVYKLVVKLINIVKKSKNIK
tara:strand:+ start:14749 stop:15846 length:1098 start_codon:yes stop_codon:yes gene_type:complete